VGAHDCHAQEVDNGRRAEQELTREQVETVDDDVVHEEQQVETVDDGSVSDVEPQPGTSAASPPSLRLPYPVPQKGWPL